ncbi:hypothetical protein [Marinobacterium sp. BA1]|uniref:hypothetical protein n=1 Tax=Marinobacterium sp. BA1 TaxID=3138931 RepID=UPI0032E6FE70
MSPGEVDTSKTHWALHTTGISAQQKLVLVALAHMADSQNAIDIDLDSLRSVVPFDTAVIRRMIQTMAERGIFADVQTAGSQASITFHEIAAGEHSATVGDEGGSRQGGVAVRSPLHRFVLFAEWEPASIGALSLFLRNKRIRPQDVEGRIYGEALDKLRQRYVGNADVKRTENQWIELYSREVLELLLTKRAEQSKQAGHGVTG